MRLVSLYRRRSAAERRLLWEAVLVLTAARLFIRLASFKRAVKLGSASRASSSDGNVGQVIWAVEAAARRLPFRTKCFEQGVAAQRLLRRRGLDAILHYGLATGTDLEAHVWVSVDREVVIGGDEARRFAEVGRWP